MPRENVIRAGRSFCVLLFGSLSLGLSRGEDRPLTVTPEQLQRTVLRMKWDLHLGSQLPPSWRGLLDRQPIADLVERFRHQEGAEDLTRLLEQFQKTPGLSQMLERQGIRLDQLRSELERSQSLLRGLESERPLPPSVTTPSWPNGNRPVPPRFPNALPGLPTPQPPPPIEDLDRPIEPSPPPVLDNHDPVGSPQVDPVRRRFEEFLPASRRWQASEKDRLRERRAMALAQAWERIFGPLDNNPALRLAIMEMVLAGEEIHGADGSDLWRFLERNTGDGAADLDEFLQGLSKIGDWRLPRLDLTGLDFRPWRWTWGNSSTDTPPMPSQGKTSSRSTSLGLSLGVSWLDDSWLPVALLVALLLGLLFAWRFWPGTTATRTDTFAYAEGLGPWPVDPRSIASREDLIKAFEYLTVLKLGRSARTWNHLVIATSLARLVHDHAIAQRLAELYASARYAPPREGVTPADLAAARRGICQLAGVSAE